LSFVQYYAELDSQPPSALARCTIRMLLQDPFGEHQGLLPSSATSPICWPTWSSAGSPSIPLCDGQRFAVTWTMHWSHPRIAGGNEPYPAGLLGGGHRRGACLHQRDYYDAGEMIYEHLPVLGWAVRGVKRRVRS
jgi:hypothetical protein